MQTFNKGERGGLSQASRCVCGGGGRFAGEEVGEGLGVEGMGQVERGRSGTAIYPRWEVKRRDSLQQRKLDVCAENAGTLTFEPRGPTCDPHHSNVYTHPHSPSIARRLPSQGLTETDRWT